MSIEWEEIYNIGITEIDEQHKILVAIINEMYSEQKKWNSSNIYARDI